MTGKHLQDNVNWLLLRVSLLAKQRLLKVSEKNDLAPMQAYTLCLIEPNAAVPMYSISDLLGCDPSNVTGIVERLSAGGYIERRESSIDRRIKTIQLTKTGRALRNKLIGKITESRALELDNLSQDEIKTLKSLLVKILPTHEA